MPYSLAIAGYMNYFTLVIVSWLRELVYGIGPHRGNSMERSREGEKRQGYVHLYATFESFYTRNIYRRSKQIFENVLSSVPGAVATFVQRKSDDDNWTFWVDMNDKTDCINLASYNYLGFAQSTGDCTETAIDATLTNGTTSGSTSHEIGTMMIHTELESTVAEFVGQECALTTGMGFATNSQNLPCILSRGDLAISDEFNHSSIIQGLQLSGATVKVCKHNNIQNLEQILRNAIINGHPRTHRPWKKIFIVVEGIYSMEGSLCKLPELIALKKKYRAYLYIDEAHSVGAMGPNGRGVVDYFGVDPKDVDIMMGTFTKSFGASGGYVAGSKELIDYIRSSSQGFAYSAPISPPVARQVITSMRSIIDADKDGLDRVKTLARNTKYFRARLEQMGVVVIGSPDSPVIPMMLFMPSKVPSFVEGCREKGLLTVGVGFPATRMTEERIRFCLSAGHTKEMLDKALDIIDEMSDYVNCKYAKNLVIDPNEIIVY